jgi:hypothetical protein
VKEKCTSHQAAIFEVRHRIWIEQGIAVVDCRPSHEECPSQNRYGSCLKAPLILLVSHALPFSKSQRGECHAVLENRGRKAYLTLLQPGRFSLFQSLDQLRHIASRKMRYQFIADRKILVPAGTIAMTVLEIGNKAKFQSPS